MQRYWKIAVLITFTVLIIGVYYTEASSSQDLNYYLKLEEGDEKEASPVNLKAHYKSDSIFINTKGSEYQRGQWSYLNRLSAYYEYDGELERLTKEYRQFMRGKRNLDALYEDDSMIGYVGTGRFDSVKGQSDTLTVSLYDKGKKGSSSFTVKGIKENAYDSLYISDVQIHEQTMKVLAFIHIRNEGVSKRNTPEVHLYTLDLDKKSLVEDHVILSGASQDGISQIKVRGDTDRTKPSSYAVFELTNSTENQELVVYDIWKGEWTKIQNDLIQDLLNGTKASEKPFIRLSSENLYLTTWNETNGIPRVIRYSMTENKVMSDLMIEDLQLNMKNSGRSMIANNRLYMVVGAAATPKVAIADLETGAMVYKGAVSRKDNQGISNLMIYDISIK